MKDRNKILNIVIAILLLTISWVQASEVGNSQPTQTPVKESKRPYRRDVYRYDLKNDPNNAGLKALRARECPGGEHCPSPFQTFSKDGQHFSPTCRQFIGKDGWVDDDSVGFWMLEAMAEVEKANQEASNNKGAANGPANTCRFNDVNFGRACPNFNNLTGQQQQHVWLWTWASYAQAESSCNIEGETKGIYNESLGKMNVASSFFGLEDAADSRMVNGRDPRFCPHTSVPSVNQIKNNEENRLKLQFFQTRCSASIMYDQACGRRLPLLSPGTYWETGLTFDRKIGDLISRHPLCKSEGNIKL